VTVRRVKFCGEVLVFDAKTDQAAAARVVQRLGYTDGQPDEYGISLGQVKAYVPGDGVTVEGERQ
jgi:hypothetical protein